QQQQQQHNSNSNSNSNSNKGTNKESKRDNTLIAQMESDDEDDEEDEKHESEEEDVWSIRDSSSDEDEKKERCGRCGTHLTSSEYVVDRQFKGCTSTAYLIASCVNVEQLTTGVHQVCDVWCKFCGNNVGWSYIDAEDKEQKYIIGHSCFEMALVLQEHAFQYLLKKKNKQRQYGMMSGITPIINPCVDNASAPVVSTSARFHQRVASLSKSVDDEMSSGDFREEKEDDDDDDDEDENESENKEEEGRQGQEN
ncbi:hypothetical protein RFI_36034, partial [Reticulomyxa filosa]